MQKSLYDPNSEIQKEADELETYLKSINYKGYWETENSEIWGYIE